MPDSLGAKNCKRKRTRKGSTGCGALPCARHAVSTIHALKSLTLSGAMGGRSTDDPCFTDEETKAQRGHSAGELQRNDWNPGFSGPPTDHILNPWLCSLLLTRGQWTPKEGNPGRQCKSPHVSGALHIRQHVFKN